MCVGAGSAAEHRRKSAARVEPERGRRPPAAAVGQGAPAADGVGGARADELALELRAAASGLYQTQTQTRLDERCHQHGWPAAKQSYESRREDLERAPTYQRCLRD